MGTPDIAASTFTITATDANGATGSQAYTLTIMGTGITPTSLPGGTVGASYSQTLSTSGGVSPFTFVLTAGSLPAGLALNSNTGTITGTPTAAGTATFTINAADAKRRCDRFAGLHGHHHRRQRDRRRACPGRPTAAATARRSASGGTSPYTFALTTGTLPAGLSLAGSTGAITGTPTTTGSSTFTITADGRKREGSAGLHGHHQEAAIAITPTVSRRPPSAAATSSRYASGGTSPYTFALTTGSLPAGLSLDPNLGAIDGSPTTAGTSTFTITATDANGATGSQPYTLTIITIAITPTSLPTGTVGVSYNQTLSATGGTGPYTFAVNQLDFPAGLSLSSSGVITGSPTNAGRATFAISATDANGVTGSQNFTFHSFVITPASLPDGSVGTSYNQTIGGGDGLAPYTFAVSTGSLPAGLSLDSSTGAITGTPTTAGNSTFTIGMSDAAGITGFRTYTVTIIAIAITPTSLPNGPVGTSYSQDARCWRRAPLHLRGDDRIAGRPDADRQHRSDHGHADDGRQFDVHDYRDRRKRRDRFAVLHGHHYCGYDRADEPAGWHGRRQLQRAIDGQQRHGTVHVCRHCRRLARRLDNLDGGADQRHADDGRPFDVHDYRDRRKWREGFAGLHGCRQRDAGDYHHHPRHLLDRHHRGLQPDHRDHRRRRADYLRRHHG